MKKYLTVSTILLLLIYQSHAGKNRTSLLVWSQCVKISWLLKSLYIYFFVFAFRNKLIPRIIRSLHATHQTKSIHRCAVSPSHWKLMKKLRSNPLFMPPTRLSSALHHSCCTFIERCGWNKIKYLSQSLVTWPGIVIIRAGYCHPAFNLQLIESGWREVIPCVS